MCVGFDLLHHTSYIPLMLMNGLKLKMTVRIVGTYLWF